MINGEPESNCTNHPLVEAGYNSILEGGKPLCLNCALLESDSIVFTK